MGAFQLEVLYIMTPVSTSTSNSQNPLIQSSRDGGLPPLCQEAEKITSVAAIELMSRLNEQNPEPSEPLLTQVIPFIKNKF